MKSNILIVDDSALLRRVECDIINSDGTFQVTDTCCDGLEAYEKLKTTRYDGVVLDVNMPRMDGLQLLEQLQKDRIRATVIMVSTTTTKDADVTIRAMERGAVDFVTKRYVRPRVTIANGASHRRLRLYRLRRGPQSRLQQPDMRSRVAARSLRLHVRRAVRRRCRVSFRICRRIWTHRWYWFSICLPDLPSQWQTDWTRSARFMSRRRKTEMC